MLERTERKVDAVGPEIATTDPMDRTNSVDRTDLLDRTDPVEKTNPDAITGAPASHPVGTGLGAASGGMAGMAIGAALGPAGSVAGGVVGVVVGAVTGGLAGKAVAEEVNPSEEDEYWSSAFAERPYVAPGSDYTIYREAYRYGWESRTKHPDIHTFDQVEENLGREWDTAKGQSSLEWNAGARDATRDAWERVGRPSARTPGNPGGAAAVPDAAGNE